MQALRSDHRKAGVRIAKHQDRIRFHLDHQLIRLGYDIADRFPQVFPYGIQIIIRSTKAQIIKKHLVQCIIVILTGMHQDLIEISIATLYHGSQPDNFRTGTDYSH